MQGFNSGDKPHVGRKPGTVNKRTQEARAIMERYSLDPLEVMILIVRDEIACSTCRGIGRTKYQPGKEKLLERTCESCYGSGKEKISPELKGKMLSELAQYKYPKRKAIDHTVEAGGSIAEAMKRALARVKELK